MRIILLIALTFSLTSAKSQMVTSYGFPNYSQGIGFINNIPTGDSLAKHKWFLSTNRSLYTGISFFKGGNANFVALPMSLQLNRRLNNNLYAFANVAATPSYINLNPTYLDNGFGKPFQSNHFNSNSNSLRLNPSASLGLMYINDARTFSISGSINVERSSYPLIPFYNAGQSHVAPARK